MGQTLLLSGGPLAEFGGAFWSYAIDGGPSWLAVLQMPRGLRQTAISSSAEELLARLDGIEEALWGRLRAGLLAIRESSGSAV